MASMRNLGNGKYRVYLCNGRKPNGKANRKSKTIMARSLADAVKQAKNLETNFRRGNCLNFDKIGLQ